MTTPSTISKNSLVSMGLVASILSVGIGATWWLSKELGAIRGEITTLQVSVTNISADGYTLSNAAEQSLRLAIENPGMRVPDPRQLGNIIVVKPNGD